MNNKTMEMSQLFLDDELVSHSDQIYQHYLVGLHYRIVEAKNLPTFLLAKKAVKMQWHLANKAVA